MKPHKFCLNIRHLSTWLNVSQASLVEDLKDGRVSARWAERWCENYYKLKLLDYNHPSYDAIDPQTGEKVSIRTLTGRGTKIQKSINQGAKRKCDKFDLFESVKLVDKFIFVDIREVPLIYLCPITSSSVRQLITSGLITPSGINPRDFYYHLGHEIDQL